MSRYRTAPPAARVARLERPGPGATMASALVLALLTVLAATPLSRLLQSLPSALATKADPALVREAATAREPVGLIVQESDPRSDLAERHVRALGGMVTRDLPIIRGFAAELPGDRLDDLAGSDAVLSLWANAPLTSNLVDIRKYDTWAANTVWRAAIGAVGLNTAGRDGSGVTVALLDTGVTPNEDFDGRILARVDLTQEEDGIDRYGHGTHMAGIIAGDGSLSGGAYHGIAAGANLVSIKAASWNGATDVSMVIAGLQWVVDHRAQYGIRVLNLSYGTNGKQSYKLDPLNYAVEQVWFSGVFVVVSAGNHGPTGGTIDKPGDDPFVVTVGAASIHDSNHALPVSEADFSGRGPTASDKIAKPDVLAPGISIVSNRAPDSTVDMLHPSARVGDHYFKGTGTSQATAVVSGIAALMFQANPSLTPDMAKAVLMASSKVTASKSGTKMVNATAAILLASTYAGPPANQGVVPSTGLGSLELSRGSFHVYAAPGGGASNPKLVKGEYDALWNKWAKVSWGPGAWSTSPFSEYTASVTGDSVEWPKKRWHGVAWDSTSWTKKGWREAGWTSSTWSKVSWNLSSWS